MSTMNTKPLNSLLQKEQEKDLTKNPSRDPLYQKFIEAALSLKVSILEPFIPEDMLLRDLDKYGFLDELNDLFESIRDQHPEDWVVEIKDYNCNLCQYGKPLAAFEVYAGDAIQPFAKFAYFIETGINGETKDIFRCSGFIDSTPF